MHLKVQLSYGATDDIARKGAYDQWRGTIFPNAMLTDLRRPEQFDMAGDLVNLNEVNNMVRISSDTSQHLAWLQDDIELEFEQLFLHNVNLEHERFIQDFGQHVLPELLTPAPAHSQASQRWGH